MLNRSKACASIIVNVEISLNIKSVFLNAGLLNKWINKRLNDVSALSA